MLYAWALVFLGREVLTFMNILPAKYILTPAITGVAAGVAILSLAREEPARYRGLVIAGLIAALVGDTLLMIVEVDLLSYGIVFFLMTHFLYIFAFIEGFSFRKWHLLPLALLIIFIVSFFTGVRGKTGGLDAAVLVYMCIISLMFFLALARYGRLRDRRSFVLLAGAALFLASDTILAVNSFLVKIPMSTIFTWAAYGPAQLLVALSCFEMSDA